MCVRNLLLLAWAGTMATAASELTFKVPAQIAVDLTRATELERTGQIRDAERILLDVIRRLEADGTSTITLGIALNNLGVLYAGYDRAADAERQFRRSMRALQGLPGKTAEQALAKTELHLAVLYLEIGRAADIRKLDLPKVMETLDSSEDQARVKAVLAGVRAAGRELDAAERMYSELLSFWTEPVRAATSQAEIATVRNNLGVIALWQGRTDVARTRLEESFREWQRFAGENPNVVKAMTNIASAYMQAKRYEDAGMWLTRSAELGRRTLGEFHPFVVDIQFARAKALKRAGRKAEAREVARVAAQARSVSRAPANADHTVDYRDLVHSAR
jgi:tetratricopeptide (TPR) repeat protein